MHPEDQLINTAEGDFNFDCDNFDMSYNNCDAYNSVSEEKNGFESQLKSNKCDNVFDEESLLGGMASLNILSSPVVDSLNCSQIGSFDINCSLFSDAGNLSTLNSKSKFESLKNNTSKLDANPNHPTVSKDLVTKKGYVKNVHENNVLLALDGNKMRSVTDKANAKRPTMKDRIASLALFDASLDESSTFEDSMLSKCKENVSFDVNFNLSMKGDSENEEIIPLLCNDEHDCDNKEDNDLMISKVKKSHIVTSSPLSLTERLKRKLQGSERKVLSGLSQTTNNK